jgi:hypothetical protein
LDDLIWRDDFKLVFLAFCKSHIRNYRLVETGLIGIVLSQLRAKLKLHNMLMKILYKCQLNQSDCP